MGWPGVIGCVIGMNSDGVGIIAIDVSPDAANQDGSFVPRGLVLRDALELRTERDPIYEIPPVVKKV